MNEGTNARAMARRRDSDFGYDALEAELARFLRAHDRSRSQPLTSAAPSRGEARAWGEAARGALARWLNAHAAAWRAVTVGIVKDEAKYDALVAAATPPGGGDVFFLFFSFLFFNHVHPSQRVTTGKPPSSLRTLSHLSPPRPLPYSIFYK